MKKTVPRDSTSANRSPVQQLLLHFFPALLARACEEVNEKIPGRVHGEPAGCRQLRKMKWLPLLMFLLVLPVAGCSYGGGGLLQGTDSRNHAPIIHEIQLEDTITGTIQKGFRFTLNPDYNYIIRLKITDPAGDTGKTIVLYREWSTTGIEDSGSEEMVLYDNGTNGDAVPGDGIYSRLWKSENFNFPAKVTNVVYVKDGSHSRSKEFFFTFTYSVNVETSHPF